MYQIKFLYVTEGGGFLRQSPQPWINFRKEDIYLLIMYYNINIILTN